MKHVEHDGCIFEFEDWEGPEQIRAKLEDYDARCNRQAQELTQYHQLRDEMLRIQKTYAEEITAVRHEAAIARAEAERARKDAEEADALRWQAEERLQENPEEVRRLLAGRDEPPSWLERRNEMLRRKLQGEENE